MYKIAYGADGFILGLIHTMNQCWPEPITALEITKFNRYNVHINLMYA